jgi:hypothetical protein
MRKQRLPVRSLLLALLALSLMWTSGLSQAQRSGPGQTEVLLLPARREESSSVIYLPWLQKGSLPSITYRADVAALIEQVQVERIVTLMRELTGESPAWIDGAPYLIRTRHTDSGEPIRMAVRYVEQHFSGLGLAVREHTWDLVRPPNLIGEITGAKQPERIVMITAHLDNMPVGWLAPGADDNASGVAGVLLAAEIFSQQSWDCTVRFAAFTGEEQGMLGSAIYAEEAKMAGETIAGVINLDMIGYDSDAFPAVHLHARSMVPESVRLAEAFAAVVSAYQIHLEPEVLVDYALGNYSDNRSFWLQGYPAILVIEDLADFTPHYHTQQDRLDTLNLEYLANNIRAAVGTLAHLGCLLPAEESPVVSPAASIDLSVRGELLPLPLWRAEKMLLPAGSSRQADLSLPVVE